MEEEVEQPTAKVGTRLSPRNIVVTSIDRVEADEEIRYKTSVGEMDRVLGGGIVPGSAMLISGDPGIGKSTILLQICKPLCESIRVLYISGEESARQIKLRALRLGVESSELYICTSTDMDEIELAIDEVSPGLVIVDSIQTMTSETSNSAAGSVSQIRECSTRIIRVAKTKEIPIFLVGHVNKDGGVAGPKVLEHMVDVVLYFEGERHMPYRILRAVKNRYGSTNEIGVFEMGESGLTEVPNPSMMLLSGRANGSPGSAVTCIMEGSRPILAEIQALIAKSVYAVPKRTSTGVDYNRVAMLLAVIEKRADYFLSNMDSFINVVGGLRLDDTSADLAVCGAIISSITGKVVGESRLLFGEVGLSGELRGIGHVQQRVSEAVRLGFTEIIMPKMSLKNVSDSLKQEATLIGISSVKELYSVL